MALVVKDRIRETTTTTGIGTLTLAGAVSGFDAFSEVGNANTTYYSVVHRDANEWEVGIGTYTSSGTTLARTTVLASSNSGSATSFAAGTKDVFCTYPAAKSVYSDASGVVNISSVAITGGTVSGITDLAVADGGTGQGSYTNGQILVGNTTGNTLEKATITAGTGISVTNGASSITIANTLAAASSTDNAVARFNGTGGALQNSAVILDDSNNITGVAAITATGLASLADITLTAANPEILGGDTDGVTYLSGGASTALGSSIRLHGDTHATLADDFMVYGSGTLQGHYDDSASTWDFQANAITTTGAISGAVGTFTGSSRVGAGGISSSPQLAVRRTSGTTEPILDVEAAIGSFTGTGIQASNTLGAAATFDLFRGVVDSDGDAGGPTTVFSVDGTGAITAGGADFINNEVTQATLKDYAETVNAIGSTGGGTQDFDLTLGNVASVTVDTSANTFTFSNPSASGTTCSLTLIITNGGSQTVNWPAAVDWAGGTAPTLTTSGIDVISFITIDGGTIWYGFPGGLAMA